MLAKGNRGALQAFQIESDTNEVQINTAILLNTILVILSNIHFVKSELSK